MEVVLSSDSGIQQPADLDDDAEVVLDPDGQIKIDDNDGNWARPGGFDIKSQDEVEGTASLISPLGTVFNSQTLPSAVQTISSVVVRSSAASLVDFTPTETQTLSNPAPTTAQLSVSLSTLLASTATLFDTAQSSSTPTSESITDTYTSLLWPFWTTSETSSFSYSSIASSSYGSLSSSVLTSSVISSSPISLDTKSMVSQSSTSNNSKTFTSTTSQSTSLRSSSTAVQLPTQAVVPISVPTALNVHNPTFYAGLTVGIIISVGLLAALVAWCIRLRSRRKRNARLMVPWGPPGDMDGKHLEAGISTFDTGRTAQAAINLGSREDLAHVQAWSPRGDRDVGEPKRAEGHFNAFYGLYDYHNARNNHFPFLSNGSPLQAAATPDSFAKRCLPAHLVADEIVSRASPADFAQSERYSRIAYPQSAYALSNYCAYDAENSSPLDDHGRNAGKPWDATARHPGEPRSTSIAARLRNSRMPVPDLPGAALASALPEGPRAANAEMEEWGQSLKASLVNAFNAVAANLGAGAPHLTEDDKLTAPPSRRSTRKSLRGANWERGFTNGKTKAHKKGSIASTASNPWTLEETGDGAGIVHIHVASLGDFKPPTSRQYVQRQACGPIYSDNYGTKSDNISPSEAQIPVVELRKPRQGFIRPNDYFEHKKVTRFTPSRSSSIYSTTSARSTAFPRGASKLPRIRSVTHWKNGCVKEQDTVVIQPDSDSISRLPSADSSIVPRRNSADDNASRALQTRLERQGPIE